nr:ATP-binding protein [Desulfobacteraceae bacterium]
LFLYQGVRVSRSTLANMELYTSNIIESMPAGLITLDSQERIVSINGRMEELLGRNFAELAGKTLPEAYGNGQCGLEPMIRQGRSILDLPVDCPGRGGERIPLKVSAARLLSRDRQPLGTVLTFRDMREIRDMEEQLERSRRLAALGRMAAGIAHEIRNPLGTLRGFAQYFSNRAQEGTSDQEYAELMIGEVDRLNRTISALLQFARPREPEFQEVALVRLLSRTGRLLADDLQSHKIGFSLDAPGEEIVLEADPDLLMQVFLNLLHNALAATAEGGAIMVGVRPQDDTVHVRVRDSGRGMSDEEKAQMFDPFFTTRKTGTGLGLAVVHQIIEQHRGQIEVDSAPGTGTEITVILPLSQDRHAKRQEDNPAG